MAAAHETEADSAIKLHGIVKRFGSLTAVDGLDLEVPYGACVGLLGPNGAGKSTTMKALTAQVIPDEGELEVLGYQLPQDSKQARAEMALVRGSLLLGQAAYRAVKQWRYQPYLINGRAVEAETFVTVDFRLP